MKQTSDHVSIIFDLMLFLVRLLINAAALWVAVQLVDGIEHHGSWWSLLFVAVVFGMLNAGIRPLLKLLSLPVIILTLGLFILESTVLTALVGGSFGKLVTRLRVARVDGSGRPLDLLLSLARVVLVCLVVPPMVFKPDGRGLHDLAVGSVTVPVGRPGAG